MNTSFTTGITSSSVEERRKYWGTNEKEVIPPKTFIEFAKEALEDTTLKILIVSGVASIIINEIMEPLHRSTAWIEGAAILMAVVIIVTVTVVNDMKKDKEFRKLNDIAESGKKVTIIRDGEINEEGKIGDVVVGDIIKLKSGMEIPGDGVVLTSFSL